MPRDLGIADRLRAAGLHVVEVDGWRDRGSATFTPQGSVDHHTAGGATGDVPSLGICINGRADLPGPLCNVLVARSNACYVVAAGRANHAGAGGWRGLAGNSRVWGVERENVGTPAEPWRPDQTATAAKVHAALVRGAATPDPALVCEHKEWAPARKIDAHTLAGDLLRWLVGIELHGAPSADPHGGRGRMFLVHPDDRPTVYLCTVGDDNRVHYLALEDPDDRDRAAKVYPLLEVKAATWRGWGGG